MGGEEDLGNADTLLSDGQAASLEIDSKFIESCHKIWAREPTYRV
jgi:hypothetical protein